MDKIVKIGLAVLGAAAAARAVAGDRGGADADAGGFRGGTSERDRKSVV